MPTPHAQPRVQDASETGAIAVRPRPVRRRGPLPDGRSEAPAGRSGAPAGRSGALERAEVLLARRGAAGPQECFGVAPAQPDAWRDGVCTLLMDAFRRDRDHELFEALAALAWPQLRQRVRARLAQLGLALDAQEVLQDTLVNVYRYPDRFAAGRAGAFRAWSSTIVDNAIRRHLRRERSGLDVQLRPTELLALERDPQGREPSRRAEQLEACQQLLGAYAILLGVFLRAYHELTERERFVLQMVEVRGMRYAELAEVLGIRPEALKMVVFRARRRIFEKLTVAFAQAGIAA